MINNPLGVGQTIAEFQRKVRAPTGTMPGNTWKAQAYGKCSRKYTALMI